MTILRVTYTVDYQVDELPNPADEELAERLVEALFDAGTGSFYLYRDVLDENPIDFEAVGWRVDAGPYGDLGTGMAPERVTGPRPA